MPGEYQLASEMLKDALAALTADPNVDPKTFERALLHQLIDHLAQTRTPADITSELQAHINRLEDGDDPVITRGC